MLRRLAAIAIAALVVIGTGWSATAQEHAPAAEPHEAAQGDGEHGTAPAGAGGGADAAHGGEAGGGGMPQLDATSFASQIFWLIVAFVVLYRLLANRALPRLTEIIEARQDRIDGDLERAAKLREEAEAAADRYKQVVADAQAKAAAEVKALQDGLAADAGKRQATLDAELAEKLAEAERRIGSAKDEALAQIQGVAVEVAQAAVGRLAGIKVTKRDTEAALGRVQREAA